MCRPSTIVPLPIAEDCPHVGRNGRAEGCGHQAGSRVTCIHQPVVVALLRTLLQPREVQSREVEA